MKGHTSNPDPSERSGPAPGDAELEGLEAGIVPMLGDRAGPTGVGPSSSEFRDGLRQAFVTGQFDGDAALEAPLEDALRSWAVPEATPHARARALQALLEGATEGGAGDQHGRARAGAAQSHDRTPVRSRAARHPAAPRQHLGLVVGGVLLAAAAAVLVIMTAGRGGDGPGPESDQHVADVASEPFWSLDAATISAFDGPDAFEDLLVDGREVASIEELILALASGRLVENGGEILRIRRGDEFVLELGPGAAVDLAPDGEDVPVVGLQIDVDRGSIRVATGPGFDSEQPLIVQTPHVSSVVTGTVFGIDVSADRTCVCCLEGSVHTTPTAADFPAIDVDANSTRVVRADGASGAFSLVKHHRGDLVALGERTDRKGYWL